MNFDQQLNTVDLKDNKNDLTELTKSLTYREKNELTAELIRKQIGSIEQIRLSMGLNKKRMCELLLIDPSTWTRWCSGKTPVPPTVYRTLQWGLAVMDKHPEFHPLMISKINTTSESTTNKTKSLPVNTEALILKEEILELKKSQKMFLTGIIVLAALSISIYTLLIALN